MLVKSGSSSLPAKNHGSSRAFFQPVPRPEKPRGQQSDQGTATAVAEPVREQAAAPQTDTPPFFSPKAEIQQPAGSATLEKPTSGEQQPLADPSVSELNKAPAETPQPESPNPEAELPQDPPATPAAAEQEQTSDIHREVDQETSQATSQLPVKAEKMEGAPTVLLPEEERAPADEGIELPDAGQAQEPAPETLPEATAPETVAQPATDAAPSAAAGPVALQPPSQAPVRREQENTSLLEELPEQEEDPGVAQVQVLNAAPPSDSEQQQDREDRRTPEEKVQEQQSYLAQFTQAAAATRARISNEIQAQIAGIAQKEQETTATIQAQTAQYIEQVRSGIAAQKEQLSVAYATALADLEARRTADAARAEQLKATKTLELQTELTTRRDAFSQFVTAQKLAPYERAESEANRADGELDQAAAQCYQEGSRVAAQYPGSDDGHPDAREASNSLARESAEDILAKKPVIREDLRARAADFDGAFDQYEADTQQQITSIENELIPGIEEAIAQFLETIQQSYDQVQSQLSTKQEESMQQLDQLEATTIEQLQQQEQQALETVGNTAATTTQLLQANEQQALGTIGQFEQSVVTLLTPSGGTPYLPGVRQTFDECMQKLGELESDGLEGIQRSVEEGTTQLDGIASAFDTEAQQTAATAQQQGSELLAASTAAIATTQNAVSQNMEQSFTGLESAVDQTRQEALAGLDQSIEERKGKILQANSEFAAELVTQVNNSIETAKQPLLDPLSDRIWSAADRATASWWEGILAAVIDLLAMFVILVIVAAILVALGVFSTITGALLMIGLVLLAGMFIYSLVSRLAAGQGWMSLVYALTDTLGITMIYQGVTNRDIATGEDLHLSTFDRWHQGTSGVLQLVMIILPFKSRIPGIRRISIPEVPGSGYLRSAWGRFAGWVEGPVPEAPAAGPRPIGDRILDFFGLSEYTRPTAPEPSDPVASDPVTTDPVQDPTTTDPVVSDPVTTDPVQDPTATDPVVSDPAAQDPVTDPTAEEPAVLRGRRPATPQQPVVDEGGNLTEYGRWYYERPSGFRNRTATRNAVWNREAALDPNRVVRDPVSGDEISPDNWNMEEKPGSELATRQREMAGRAAGRGEFLDDYNDPENYRPRENRPTAEFSGPRPPTPQQPVLDAEGELTDYGRWYYDRPAFRTGMRETVWDRAASESIDGVVRDPLTLEEMPEGEPWEMGHKYGFEFWKHRLSAARRGIGVDQFRTEYNNPNHYRPELPSSNHSHQGEAPAGVYYGD